MFYHNRAFQGGGLFTQGGNPRMDTVYVDSNRAESGGGMYVHESLVQMWNVRFMSNTAVTGGGMYNKESAGTVSIQHVLFTSNQARNGGGMANEASSIHIEQVTFIGNNAQADGGGVYNLGGSITELVNVTMHVNEAVESGGAIANRSSQSTLSHVTVYQNRTLNGGAIDNDGASSAQISGSIIEYNQYDQVSGENFTISNSAVQGGFPGEGNINQNALLGGYYPSDPFTYILPLLPGSPAIDAVTGPTNPACPADDQRGVIRPQGAACDMGAYEARPFILTPVNSEPISARVNQNFPTLSVIVSGTGGDMVYGGRITFSPPVDGASAQISPVEANIINNRATITATANDIVGSYEVTAQARGAADAYLHLRNVEYAPMIFRVTPQGMAGDAMCGQAWDIPCDLQLTLRFLAGGGDQVWVSNGVYSPSAGNQFGSFSIPSGVQVFGGFVGNEENLEQRDWQANLTMLSGDIDHNDVAEPYQIIGKNSYTVVTFMNVDPTTRLDGFTITGGKTNSQSIAAGGLFNQNGSPTLTNLNIFGNIGQFGSAGGMYSIGGAPDLRNVTFEKNIGTTGGLRCDNCSPVLTDVSFTANNGYNGGGMSITSGSGSSRALLERVTFLENTANRGGGLFVSYGDSTHLTLMTNVTFMANHANTGGGIYQQNHGSKPDFRLAHGTLYQNTASQGAGLYFTGLGATPVITGSIFWGSSTYPVQTGGSSAPEVSYSVVQYGYPGTGNTADDPRLGNLSFYGGLTETIPLYPGSSAVDSVPVDQCVDALGNPLTNDQRGISRPKSSSCDIGAFEMWLPFRIFLPGTLR